MSNRIIVGVEYGKQPEPPPTGFTFTRRLGSSDRARLVHRPEVGGHNKIEISGGATDVILTQGSHVHLPSPNFGVGQGDGKQVRILSRGASVVECDSAAINGQHKCVKFAGYGTVTLISESGVWLVLSDHGAVFVS